jgi:transposase
VEAANRFNCGRRTVAEIWRRYKTTVSDDLPAGDIESKIPQSTSGRKKGHTKEELDALILAVPHKQRSTMRDLSRAINIPMTTMHRYLKEHPLLMVDVPIIGDIEEV